MRYVVCLLAFYWNSPIAIGLSLLLLCLLCCCGAGGLLSTWKLLKLVLALPRRWTESWPTAWTPEGYTQARSSAAEGQRSWRHTAKSTALLHPQNIQDQDGIT